MDLLVNTFLLSTILLQGCLYNTLFDLDPYPWPHPPGKYPTLDRHDDVVTRRRSSSDVDRHGGVVIVRLPMSIVMAASSPDVVRLPIVTRHRRLSTSIVVMVDVDFDVDIFYSVVWYVAAGKQGRTSMMSLAYGALETTSQYNFSIICLSNGYIWLLSLST